MRRLDSLVALLPIPAGLLLWVVVMTMPKSHNGMMASVMIGFVVGAFSSILFVTAMENLKKARLMSAGNRRGPMTIDGIATRVGER